MAHAGAGRDHESLLVWVDAWQVQCCGDPFSVGSRVEWTLYEESDREWLTAVLGDELAAEVTHGEEHHGGVADDAPTTIGVVDRIRAVSSRFGPDPTNVSAAAPNQVPIPATAAVVEVAEADGWYPDDGDRHFNGYLVDVHPTKG